MKESIYSIILIVVLLSGCAKVTQEGLPCVGARPTTPVISDLIAPQGYTSTVFVQNYQYGTTIIFKSPNGTILTSTNGQLDLDFSYTTNYGFYIATSYGGACGSIPDTFYVGADFIGNPPCTITSNHYNLLSASNGMSFYFSPGSYGSNTCNSNVDLNAQTFNGNYNLDIYLQGSPVMGTYCQLITSCLTSNGQAYASLTYNGSTSPTYASTGGKVYFNQIGSLTYATFCDASFVDLSNRNTFTLTGNVQYY